MRTIAVVNQKGGCGKTTTAINLAAFLARAGRTTLVVDMDPQGHATLGLTSGTASNPRTMYDVLVQHRNGRETRLADITRRVEANLDVAPADILLAAAPERLAGLPNREYLLSEVLEEPARPYDYVIVDCAPHVGLLTFNALLACSEAIVPVDPSFFSLHGIGKLLETFDVLSKETGHAIAARALVTLYSGRSQFARDVVHEICAHLPDRYYNTVIRHSVKLAEAASHGVPIAAYCSRSAGFHDYQALATEVLERETGRRAEAAPAAASSGVVDASPGAPRSTPEGVVFSLEAPGARRVQLVGDFNGWLLEANEMRPAGSVFTQVLKLPPGRYQYLYVVDGDWRPDPMNARLAPSPYGGHNSLLVLDESAAS
jgi:chromosome partitioning protein